MAARVLRAAAWFSLPSAAAFAALTLFGPLSLTTAVIAWGAVVALSIPLVRPIADGVATLTDFVHREAAGDRPERSGLGAALTQAVCVLGREWRQRGAELKDALAANEAILQSLPEPLLLLDEAHVVTFANAAARAVLGLKPVGKDLVAVLRAPAVLGALEAAAAGEDPPEVTVELSGETPRTFAARFQALDRTESSGGTTVLVLHDISEMWRTERLRADFVANASHEIRTPLSTLVGAVETMQGPARDDPEARDKFLAMMQDQAGRIKSLVDDLLSLSRIERSEHDAPSATVELANVLELARGSLDWKAEERSVSVDLDIPADDIAVIGDPDDLRQLFENLIDNAIKYGRGDGTVSIGVRAVAADTLVDGWRARGPAVAVAVRDNGPGIPLEHLPRLTERFYRVDKARSRRMGGTGLGLAIVKHLVSRHRGTMTIESEPGRGSCFTVFLNRAGNGNGGG